MSRWRAIWRQARSQGRAAGHSTLSHNKIELRIGKHARHTWSAKATYLSGGGLSGGGLEVGGGLHERT